MLLRSKLTIAGLMLSLTPFGIAALAQQPQKSSPLTSVQQPPTQTLTPKAKRHGARLGGFRVLNQLNLTDEQKQQARSIIQGSQKSTKAQRHELRPLAQQWRQGSLTPEGLARANELRKQLIEARKSRRAQLMAILTPEQKAKLEEIIKTRKANHGLFGRPNKPRK